MDRKLCRTDAALILLQGGMTMQPIALLMKEHRLIERMLPLIHKEARKAVETRQVDLAFLDAVVDFIRWYVDKTHHAKEEEILFKDLSGRDLVARDRELMAALITEHEYGRKTVTRLVEAKIKYVNDHDEALNTIRDTLEELAGFYQEHINKEDNIFFPAAMNYLGEREKAEMILAFQDSDRMMIHEKYQSVIDQYEHLKR
jgi:hemerythrin-like domain-containing protein